MEMVKVRKYPVGLSVSIPAEYVKVFADAEFAKVECIDGKVIYSPVR
jgi:hypothetical protein